MEDFAMGLALTLWLCFTYWLVSELHRERKINAGHKEKIEAITADKHVLQKENDMLDSIVELHRSARKPPSLKAFPELFSDEEMLAANYRSGPAALARRREDFKQPGELEGWPDEWSLKP